MTDMNRILLVGRLGQDPVRRTTKKGNSLTRFPVATSRGPNDPTQWHQIVVWGKSAESCATYLRKGDPVFIEGTVRSRKYEVEGGQDRWTVEVHAYTVNFLGTRGGVRSEGPEASAADEEVESLEGIESTSTEAQSA